MLEHMYHEKIIKVPEFIIQKSRFSSFVLLDINNLQRQTIDHHSRLSISHPNQIEIMTLIN